MVVGQHYFKVTFGNNNVSFAKVSGMERSMEYETLQEGGVNSGPRLLPLPQKQIKTMRFERGLQKRGFIINSLAPGMKIDSGIGVSVLNPEGKAIAKFTVKDVTVVKWELGGLDAQGNGVLLETFEIAYGSIKKELV